MYINVLNTVLIVSDSKNLLKLQTPSTCCFGETWLNNDYPDDHPELKDLFIHIEVQGFGEDSQNGDFIAISLNPKIKSTLLTQFFSIILKMKVFQKLTSMLILYSSHILCIITKYFFETNVQ